MRRSKEFLTTRLVELRSAVTMSKKIEIDVNKDGRIVKYEPLTGTREVIGYSGRVSIDRGMPTLTAKVDGFVELDAPAIPFSEPDTGDHIDPGSTAGKILADLRRRARTALESRGVMHYLNRTNPDDPPPQAIYEGEGNPHPEVKKYLESFFGPKVPPLDWPVPKPADILADLRSFYAEAHRRTWGAPELVTYDEAHVLRAKLDADVVGRGALAMRPVVVGIDPAFGPDETIYTVIDRVTGEVVEMRTDYKSLETRALEETAKSYFQSLMAGDFEPKGTPGQRKLWREVVVERFGQRYDPRVGVPSPSKGDPPAYDNAKREQLESKPLAFPFRC